MPVSARLRFEILRRDGFRCHYCGATPGERELHVDHVIPEALGGTDEPGNLVTACVPCNLGKASVPPDAPTVAAVSAAAERWAGALQEARMRMAYEDGMLDDARMVFLDAWEKYTVVGSGERVPLPADWGVTIDRFSELGFNKLSFARLVETAMHSLSDDVFRYFCGIVWNRVREQQRIALEVLEG